GGQLGRKHLDRHALVEPRVSGLVDRTETAAADLPDDLIALGQHAPAPLYMSSRAAGASAWGRASCEALPPTLFAMGAVGTMTFSSAACSRRRGKGSRC